jgi:hypothetical protein
MVVLRSAYQWLLFVSLCFSIFLALERFLFLFFALCFVTFSILRWHLHRLPKLALNSQAQAVLLPQASQLPRTIGLHHYTQVQSFLN